MRRWSWVLGLVVPLAVAAAVPTSAAPPGPESLRGDLDRILADPRLDGAHAGVVVRDPVSDEVLYRRDGASRATPASNAKLFTSAAALESLGPDYRFRTEVSASGQRRGEVLRGDLHLRGTGDPTMLAADYDRLAERVAASGIRQVRGRLLTDDTWFDEKPLGPGWAWDDEPYAYGAPVSALTVAPNTDYDAGSVLVRVTPGERGAPARAELDPATRAVEIDNRSVTGPPGTPPSVTVEREHGTGRIVVSGSIPQDSAPVEEQSSVPDPSAYAADVFARALAARGVTVGGTGAAPVPEGARVLGAHDSMPLRQLLVPFLKLSNNGHAEVLTKAMGRRERNSGSWDAGTAVLKEKLRGLGVDPGELRMVDGSGLSTMDVVTPGQVTALLDNARQRPWFGPWYEALPVAGVADRQVGGTLRNRMGGTPAERNVHAKTGSLSGVSSLSGYATTANGRPLVFSVLLNDFLGDSPQDLEDAVAVRLAEEGRPEARSRPRVPRSEPPADDPETRVDESDLECSWVGQC